MYYRLDKKLVCKTYEVLNLKLILSNNYITCLISEYAQIFRGFVIWLIMSEGFCCSFSCLGFAFFLSL
jgi:Ni,Fe-hydrogenase I small subunit